MVAYSWFDRLWGSVSAHCEWYVRYFGDQWNHMGPVGYTSVLITIALVGFLLMGRGNKRT